MNISEEKDLKKDEIKQKIMKKLRESGELDEIKEKFHQSLIQTNWYKEVKNICQSISFFLFFLGI